MEKIKMIGRSCLPVKKVINALLLIASVAVFGVDLATGLLYNFALWLLPLWILTGVLAVVCLVVAFWLRRSYVRIEITDRRVAMRNAYDKRYEIPLTAVVGVGSSSLFHRVMISTAAGSFVCIYQENYRELAEVIAADLLAREGETEPLSLLKDEEDEEAVAAPAADATDVKQETIDAQ